MNIFVLRFLPFVLISTESSLEWSGGDVGTKVCMILSMSEKQTIHFHIRGERPEF